MFEELWGDAEPFELWRQRKKAKKLKERRVIEW